MAEVVPHIHLRAVGAATGFKIKRPLSMDALRAVASRLVLGGNQTRGIFDRSGDSIADYEVVSPGDVLFVSHEALWHPPPEGRLQAKSGKATKSGLKNGKAKAGKAGATSTLAEALLSPALRNTPVRRADETPARLCGGRPPYGLMGDPTQLGSDANFTRLRGSARAQAHVGLCVKTARRMQARNLETVGRSPHMFPAGAACAVVGSGGSLMASRHGRAIDAHDVVMRFNLAPAGGEWHHDVGNRTTIRILTDKVVAPFLRSNNRRVGRSVEPESTLLLYCMAQGWVGKCMHEHRVGHVNPVFIRYLRTELDTHNGRGRLPSAGIAGIAMAMSHCRSVTLYGFGNASDAKTNGTGGHASRCGHYWDCKRQQDQYFAGKQGYHDWNAQWAVLSGWIEAAAANASIAHALRFVDG